MITDNWEFQLVLVDDVIACVGGVKVQDKELCYDCTHKDYTKDLYGIMCKQRMINLKINHLDKSFYLFTEHEYLIKTHLNSGLVLLDQKSTLETFTCRYTKQEYSDMTNNYYIFRTVISDSYKSNLIRYISNYGTCSGIYIGDGVIITAGHCWKDLFGKDELDNPKISIIKFGMRTIYIPPDLQGSIYKYYEGSNC